MAFAKPSRITALRGKNTPPAFRHKLPERDVRSIKSPVASVNRCWELTPYEEWTLAIRAKDRARRPRTQKYPFTRKFVELVSRNIEWDLYGWRLGKIDTVIRLHVNDRADGFCEITADHAIKTDQLAMAPVPRFRYQIFPTRGAALDAALEHFTFWYRTAVVGGLNQNRPGWFVSDGKSKSALYLQQSWSSVN